MSCARTEFGSWVATTFVELACFAVLCVLGATDTPPGKHCGEEFAQEPKAAHRPESDATVDFFPEPVDAIDPERYMQARDLAQMELLDDSVFRYLGHGAQAYVFGGKWRPDPNRHVAMKIFAFQEAHTAAEAAALEYATTRRLKRRLLPGSRYILDALCFADLSGSRAYANEALRKNIEAARPAAAPRPDFPFLILEYAGGGSLSQGVERGIGPADIHRIFGQLSDALGAIHENGTVHRDLKPDNILLTDAGEVRLADLSLAAWQGITDNMAFGSIQYASFNQLYPLHQIEQGLSTREPHPKPADDLYSLSVVLEELVMWGLAHTRVQDLPLDLNYRIRVPVLGRHTHHLRYSAWTTFQKLPPPSRSIAAPDDARFLRQLSTVAWHKGYTDGDLFRRVLDAALDPAQSTANRFLDVFSREILHTLPTQQAARLVFSDSTLIEAWKADLLGFDPVTKREILDFARTLSPAPLDPQLSDLGVPIYFDTQAIEDMAQGSR